MCNHALRERYMLKYAADVLAGLEIPDPMPEFTPHAYPKSPSPIVVEEAGRRQVAMLRWGISYPVKGKPSLVTNARDDQLLRIALWKESVAKRRCLIPVIGYFEPGLGPPGAKGELFFTIRNQPAFFIAGLWTTDADGSRAYAMVTTSPNDYTAPFHDRQPVALSETDAVAWLGSQPLPAERVVALTRPPPSDVMQHEVIAAVPRAKKAAEDGGEVTGELDLGM
jgi:putative SOS response-associated peptidase YedK